MKRGMVARSTKRILRRVDLRKGMSERRRAETAFSFWNGMMSNN
jgi:hypothetical protein